MPTQTAPVKAQSRTATRLAWALWALSLLMMAAVVGFAFLARGYAEPPGAMPLFPRLMIFLPGTFAFQTVGALIAARQPRNPVGWLFLASSLAAWLGGFAESYWRYALLVRPGELPGGMLMLLVHTRPYTVGTIFELLLILLFPSGRPLSRRWWLACWLAILGALTILTALVLMPGPLDPAVPIANPVGLVGAAALLQRISDLGTALQLIGTFAAVLSLILRLRRARGVERQQVKLLVSALVVYLAAQSVIILAVARSWQGLTAAADLSFVLQSLASVLVAVAAGVAILRYRLWDIDIIIRRTLVYGALTLTLGLVYVGCILLSRTLVAPYIGGSELAIVASTLAIAALFNPLRRRIQNLIDKRFYRRKYNAAKVLAAFGTTAREIPPRRLKRQSFPTSPNASVRCWP